MSDLPDEANEPRFCECGCGQCFQCGDQLVPAASSIAKRYETRAADQVTVNRADLAAAVE